MIPASLGASGLKPRAREAMPLVLTFCGWWSQAMKVGTFSSGQSCNSCHPDGQGMAKSAAKANLAETINTCIVKALKGKALDVKSVEMQSMVLYIQSLGKK